jgi:hypothetical protein
MKKPHEVNIKRFSLLQVSRPLKFTIGFKRLAIAYIMGRTLQLPQTITERPISIEH